MASGLFWFFISLIGLYLAFVPLLILRELKSQGQARADEASMIISLLSTIISPPTAATVTSHLQALTDVRSQASDHGA